MSTSIYLSIPATSANLGPGFDCLGLALDRRLELWAEPASNWSFQLEGEGSDSLPTDGGNMIAATCRKDLAHFGCKAAFRVRVVNPVPVSRGLGSSSTAVVAGLALAQLARLGRVDREELFVRAAAVEGHPDNVAPAIFGGLQDCKPEGGGFARRKAPIDPRIQVLTVVPSVSVSTEKMRGVLPATYPDELLAANRHACQVLLNGLAEANVGNMKYSEKDRVHQPYRLAIQPISKAVYEMLREHPKIAGAFLSGSGATVAGWVVAPDNPSDHIKAKLQAEEIDAYTWLLAVDHKGLIVQKQG